METTYTPTLPESLTIYDEVINTLEEWLSAIYPSSQMLLSRYYRYYEHNETLDIKPHIRIIAKIWTFNNEYTITVRVDADGNMRSSYLGCSAQSRKSRTGENWCRGNDLADGHFCETTWYKILGNIVKYEAEEIKSDHWKRPLERQG